MVETSSYALGRYRIALARRSGDLVGLQCTDTGVELISDRRLGENFRLLIPRPERENVYFCSSAQTASSISATDSEIVIAYDRLVRPDEIVEVAVQYRLRLAGDGIDVSIELDNGCGRDIAEVTVGLLGGMTGVGDQADSRSLFPGAHSNIIPDIFREFPSGDYGGGNLGIEYSACGITYPGYGGLSMSWLTYFNESREIGLYYGCHEPSTRLSAVLLELRPCTSTAELGGNWPRPDDLPDDEPRGLTTGWVFFPYAGPGHHEFGPIHLATYRGDWRVAADRYRMWFDSHTTVVPRNWLREEMAWQSTILKEPEGHVNHTFADMPAFAAAGREAGITVLEMCGWDIGGIDRGFPDYRPDPELGAADELSAAMAAMSTEGTRPVIFANLQVADTGAADYQQRFAGFEVHHRWAPDVAMLGFGEGTFGSRMGFTRPNMAVLSLAHPELRRHLTDQLGQLVDGGAAALQLDKTVVVEHLDFNPRAPLPPDQSTTIGLLECLEEVYQRGRASRPDFELGSEIWWDRTFAWVSVLYTRVASIDIDHEALLYTFPEIASTIFAENPTDINVMNNGMRYGMVWALAPRHYRESVDERLTRPLAHYVAELIRIRKRHSERLFHGRLTRADAVDVSIDDADVATPSPNPIRSSVFSGRDGGQPLATVVVNYGTDPVDVTVARAGWAGPVEVCQPMIPDRAAHYPVHLTLPARSLAVVAELGEAQGRGLSMQRGERKVA